MLRTPKITDSHGKVIPGSITSFEKKEIGDVKQWLLIRGKSVNNPVLLFLHGGPGSAEWPLVRYYNLILEDYFTIAYWEQRGAGKSYSKNTPNMNINQFISDTRDISQFLRIKFNQEKIFIIGHSWGSILGIFTVQKYPELYHAYIGIGQFVKGIDNEKISYQYVMEMARRIKNKKAITQLEHLNSSNPYLTIDEKGEWFKKLMIQRDWLFRFGGCVHKKTTFFKWAWPFFLSPEYTMMDLIKWLKGYNSSIKTLWPEIMNCDLIKQAPHLDIPIYILAGKHDYNTPFELTEKYFKQLKAPKKELIWFENSSHNPIYEEADKFNDYLINKVRTEVNK